MTTLLRCALILCPVLLLPGCHGNEALFAFFQREVRVNEDHAEDATDPDVCCDGRNVYMVWKDQRNGNDDIFFSRSTDGGRTWSADVRLDSGNSTDQGEPVICCAGQRIYAAWSDTRDGAADIYVNYSTDGGVTWMGDRRLDTDTAGDAESTDPVICCAGLRVYVAWEDDRNGEEDIYFNHSSDGGDHWQVTDRRLNTNDPGDSDSYDVTICCDSVRVYAVWLDDRNGGDDVYSNYSHDGGATFQGTDIRVDLGDAPGASDADDVRVCCDGLRVYAVWVDDRHSDDDICGAYSFDGGATWIGSILINDQQNTTADEPTICCEGLNVYVAWVDRRNGEPDVFADYSRDGGITWQTDDRLDTGDPPGDNDSSEPQICCADPYVYVVFRDDRNAEDNDDIYFNYSTDNGVTWLSNDKRLNTGIAAGDADADDPRICCNGTNVYTAWEDDRKDPGMGDELEDVWVNGTG